MITLEINIGRIRKNIAIIKKRVKARIYAVVKAQAYGHGFETAAYIQDSVYGFAVSNTAEAYELAKRGVIKPILILCPAEAADCSVLSGCKATGYGNVIYTVCRHDDLRCLNNCRVAVKVNTGMNRLGANVNSVGKLISKISSRSDLVISEMFTHFCEVGSAAQQLSVFEPVIGIARSMDIAVHACASNCLKLGSEFHLDAVRCGLAIYGYGEADRAGCIAGDNGTDSCPGFLKNEIGLLPALSAYTKIVQINYVKKGERIGYGSNYAPHDMKVAVLMAGYADGFRRADARSVVIAGVECGIFGNVCMDMCMADVSKLKHVKVGDRAYLLNDCLNAQVLAERLGIVPYEILTAFSGDRIKRIYV